MLPTMKAATEISFVEEGAFASFIYFFNRNPFWNGGLFLFKISMLLEKCYKKNVNGKNKQAVVFLLKP